MPNLNDSTADGYAAFWEVLRMSLLVLGVCLRGLQQVSCVLF